MAAAGAVSLHGRKRHAALTERSRETADLTLRLLEFLAAEPGQCGVTELAQQFDTSKATIHRHLRTLANREFVLSALADNSTDLAITGLPPDSVDVVAQNFMGNPLVVIAAPHHPLAGQSSIALQRLADETLVVREPGSGTRAAMERHFAEHGLVYRAGCELGTNEAIKQAVRAGLGLAVVSAQTIELELATRCLAVLPVEGFPIVRQWYVVHRSGKRLSAAARTFRDLLLALDPDADAKAAERLATDRRVA